MFEAGRRAANPTTSGGRLLAPAFPVPLARRHTARLTPRETEIITLVAEGLSNKQIAEIIGIKAGTIGGHLHNIYIKLNVRSRTEAATKHFRVRPVGAADRDQISALREPAQ